MGTFENARRRDVPEFVPTQRKPSTASGPLHSFGGGTPGWPPFAPVTVVCHPSTFSRLCVPASRSSGRHGFGTSSSFCLKHYPVQGLYIVVKLYQTLPGLLYRWHLRSSTYHCCVFLRGLGSFDGHRCCRLCQLIGQCLKSGNNRPVCLPKLATTVASYSTDARIG
jgi:hypothetical protein